MDCKEFIKAFLSKTQGMEETEIASLYDEEGNLKSDSIDTALAKDSNRIKEKNAAWEEKVTKAHEKGFAKAQGEIMHSFEDDFKKAHNIKSDKKGLELINEVIAKKSIDKTITDEDIKKHPLFLAEEAKSKAVAEQKDKEWKEVIDKRESEIKQKESLSTVLQEAYTILEELKPNLPENATLKKNQLKWFEQDIAKIKFDIKDDGNGKRIIVPLKENGDRLEDEYGKAIPLNELVKKTASGYWDFKQSDDRSTPEPNRNNSQNSGGNGQAGQGDKKWKFTKPKDNVEKWFQEEYAKIEGNKNLNPSEKTQAKTDLTTLFQEEPAK